MPQMAPISWLILFIMFSITFMIFNSLNYYNYLLNNNTNNNNNESENSSNNKSSTFLNWKW